MRGLETAYRLFGLLPDTLQLRALLLDLYAEQVAGYYDPDSATLFGVGRRRREQLRLVLAHEMVHALQGQYIPLDSILKRRATTIASPRRSRSSRARPHWRRSTCWRRVRT